MSERIKNNTYTQEPSLNRITTPLRKTNEENVVSTGRDGNYPDFRRVYYELFLENTNVRRDVLSSKRKVIDQRVGYTYCASCT